MSDNTTPRAEAEAFRDEQTANAELRRQIEHWRGYSHNLESDLSRARRQIEERDATIAEQARRLKEAVLAERDRCLRVIQMNNDNDAHRYYMEHPEFFPPRPTPATSGETPVPDDAFDDYIAGPDGWIRNSKAAPQPPTDLVERAREIISEWLEHDLSSWLDTELAELRELIIAALAAERAEGTRRERERCAKIANEWLWADYDEAHEQLDFAIAARRVDAVLAAIEASGTHCIAPLEPTEDMWRAGVRTLANHQNSSAPLDEIMGLVYCAMLVARPRDVAPGEQSDAV